jgi:hypothetical protein
MGEWGSGSNLLKPGALAREFLKVRDFLGGHRLQRRGNFRLLTSAATGKMYERHETGYWKNETYGTDD